MSTLTLDKIIGSKVTLSSSLTLAEATEDADTGARVFECLAIPYEVEVDRRDYRFGTAKLRIAAGAMTFRDNAKVHYGHDWESNGTPIGRVVSTTDAAEGPTTRCRLANTEKAGEVWELMQLDEDGAAVLDQVSTGFYITEYAVENADTDTPTLVVLAGDAIEVSVVPYPQYDDARVKSLNHRTEGAPPMTVPTLTLDSVNETVTGLADTVETLGEHIETLGAKIATSGDPVPAGPAMTFANYGEFVMAMAKGDEAAHAIANHLVALEYEGGKVADTTYGTTWVGDVIRWIEKARKVYNLYDSAPLPAEGMKLEYGKVASNTIDVDKQLEEGDLIVMGNIKLGTDFADVLTFAGGSELSLQQVLRSSVNVIDMHFGELARVYGRVTEAYVRTIVAAITTHQTIGTMAQLDEWDGWIDFFIDAGLHFDEKGLEVEHLKISADRLKVLAKLREGVDGPYLVNHDKGTVNLLNASGEVSGVPITLVPGANIVELGNSSAVKTFESPGAPTRLGPQKEITNLTEVIGVYGFGAVAVQDPKAIVRPAAV